MMNKICLQNFKIKLNYGTDNKREKKRYLQLESAPKCANSIQYVVLKNIHPWMS